MGIYLNPGNEAFEESVNSEIYQDKSGLIAFTNKVLETEQKYLCVSRPRRFGKSMAAKMLAAYYDKSCNSHRLFENLQIALDFSYEKQINKSSVLYLDISWFRTMAGNARQVQTVLQREVISELRTEYPEVIDKEVDSLPLALANINQAEGEKFVVIIDEWDCLFREDRFDEKAQEEYIGLLRGLFKSAPASKYIRLAYMTGILPVKKYGTQSALNNFKEFTMVNPGALSEYVGFTEMEVCDLCGRYHMEFEEAKHWYDGYYFSRVGSVYSPRSVVEAMLSREFGNYWTGTETYEALKMYIDMDFDGLKDAVIGMLGGQRCKINPQKFQNDMTGVRSRDDVMTLLIHLGYLAYDGKEQEAYIPNQEVADEFENAMESSGWEEIARSLRASETLLKATLQGDGEAVAQGLDSIHAANTSVLAYHNELSLSCAITLAYYCARKDYTLIREMPAGKGFADIAFIPRKHSDKPAMVVELKWDTAAEGAISQIRSREYAGALKEYAGEILLVGISYDKKDRKHKCIIESYFSRVGAARCFCALFAQKPETARAKMSAFCSFCVHHVALNGEAVKSNN